MAKITNADNAQGSGTEIVWYVILAVAIVLCVAIRLYGLDLKGISHPEVFVPGIALPPGISAPPPRTGFAENLWWHFHYEPHPVGWYLAMFGWTSVAGTSEWALRFPSVIFAAASVPVAFAISRRIFGPAVAALLAMMFALHGFHYFWSQIARMYTAGTFLGLLSTWQLIELSRSRVPRVPLEIAYVLCVVAGTQTVDLFWPFLGIQMAWAGVLFTDAAGVTPSRLLSPRRIASPRLVQVQAIAFMLSAPGLSHAVYLAREDAVSDPALQFAQEYLSFGFLFAHDTFTIPERHLAQPLAYLLLGTALVLLVAGLRQVRTQNEAAAPSQAALPIWLAPVVAITVALFMVWLASIAHSRGKALLVLSVLPLLALGVPRLAVATRVFLAWVAPRVDARLAHTNAPVLLIALLGVLAPVLLFVASLAVSVTAARAFLLFVPFLLTLCAAGALGIFRSTAARLAMSAAVIVLFGLSVPYYAAKPVSPRDYKEIANQIRDRMEPGDLFFVKARNWVYTPLFYYLPDVEYVTEDYINVAKSQPQARIWLIVWPNVDGYVSTDERQEALLGRKRIVTLDALRARAELFVSGAAP